MGGKRLATTLAQLAVTGAAIALNTPTVHAAGVGDHVCNLQSAVQGFGNLILLIDMPLLGAGLAIRFLYLPLPGRGPLDSDPIPVVKALTQDFVAMSQLAFRRRPLMPKTGIYLGRDEYGRPVFWNPSIIRNPHMLALGGFGLGKSTLVKTLIFRAEILKPYTGTGEAPAFIIIDPAGEYADKAGELEEQGVSVTVIDLCNRKYNPPPLSGLPSEKGVSRFVDNVLPNGTYGMNPERCRPVSGLRLRIWYAELRESEEVLTDENGIASVGWRIFSYPHATFRVEAWVGEDLVVKEFKVSPQPWSLAAVTSFAAMLSIMVLVIRRGVW